ncbi:MAG: hypothetical protein AB7D27_10450 [Desulfomicrobium sp.]
MDAPESRFQKKPKKTKKIKAVWLQKEARGRSGAREKGANKT